MLRDLKKERGELYRQRGQKVQRPRVVASDGRMVLLGCRRKSSQGRMCPWKASRCVQKLGVGIGRGTMALLCRQC